MLKLKELRCERGISQGELAEKINVQNYTIGNWERERAEPNIEMIIRLADVLGVTTDELLGRDIYGTGVIEIKGERLSTLENQLLAVFRKLPDENKRRAIGILEALNQ